jgi:hypothetical protein
MAMVCLASLKARPAEREGGPEGTPPSPTESERRGIDGTTPGGGMTFLKKVLASTLRTCVSQCAYVFSPASTGTLSQFSIGGSGQLYASL